MRNDVRNSLGEMTQAFIEAEKTVINLESNQMKCACLIRGAIIEYGFDKDIAGRIVILLDLGFADILEIETDEDYELLEKFLKHYVYVCLAAIEAMELDPLEQTEEYLTKVFQTNFQLNFN